jgi:hypothetical protein
LQRGTVRSVGDTIQVRLEHSLQAVWGREKDAREEVGGGSLHPGRSSRGNPEFGHDERFPNPCAADVQQQLLRHCGHCRRAAAAAATAAVANTSPVNEEARSSENE